jgi:hypothetical protein
MFWPPAMITTDLFPAVPLPRVKLQICHFRPEFIDQLQASSPNAAFVSDPEYVISVLSWYKNQFRAYPYFSFFSYKYTYFERSQLHPIRLIREFDGRYRQHWKKQDPALGTKVGMKAG